MLTKQIYLKMEKESNSIKNLATFTCVICSKEKELVSVGMCDHHGVCSYCSMKCRLHYDNKKCPICLQNLDTIFICEFTDKTPYQTLIKKKEAFYEDEEFEKNGIYYTTIEGKEEALNLRRFNCPIKNCHTESFENINSLSEHLNNEHKSFYCQYCLKENKLFLSEMHIYKKSNFEEHIKYGEYDNNTLISPPHPSCPFDGKIFYNDEQFFSHMKSFHFICQLCRDTKNILFFPELKNLLEHYKVNHYYCSFQECLDEFYIVFRKEEELLNHLITKHKSQKAKERLNILFFEEKDNDTKKIKHVTGEFNFTEFIKNLKKESENYNNNKKNKFININKQNFNDEGIEVIYKYESNIHKYNNYINYNNKNNRGNRNRYNKGNSKLHNIEEVKNNNNSEIQNHNYINENKINNQYSNKSEQDKNKYKKLINYSFLFTFYLNIIKEIITNIIKKDNIAEKLVRLPKETIYQITVIIHKFNSNNELLELTYLKDFGIDLELHKTLKSVISSNIPENEQTFKKTLENVELKKLLIIYKYLDICSKKVDNLFYSLDLEQINEDLYEDFCERPKKEDVVMNKYEREKRNRQAFLRAELNMGIKEFLEDKRVTETKYEKKKTKEEKKENNSPISKPNN